LLAALAGHVTSVEIVPELSASAKHKLRSSHCDNVTLEVGDGSQGWGTGYDAIV